MTYTPAAAAALTEAGAVAQCQEQIEECANDSR